MIIFRRNFSKGLMQSPRYSPVFSPSCLWFLLSHRWDNCNGCPGAKIRVVFHGGLFCCNEILMIGDGHLSVSIRKDLESSKEFYWLCFCGRRKFCETSQSCTKNYRKLTGETLAHWLWKALPLSSKSVC